MKKILIFLLFILLNIKTISVNAQLEGDNQKEDESSESLGELGKKREAKDADDLSYPGDVPEASAPTQRKQTSQEESLDEVDQKTVSKEEFDIEQNTKSLKQERNNPRTIRQKIHEGNKGLTASQKRAIHEKAEEEYRKIMMKGDDILIWEKNVETGVYERTYNISHDRNRLSLYGNLNANLAKATSLVGADVQYQFNVVDFLWAGAIFNFVKADFRSVSENPTNTTDNLLSESNNPRPDNTNTSIMTFGVGIQYRLLYPEVLNFLKINNLFTNIGCYLTYSKMDEDFMSRKYQGLGLRAEYELYKRNTYKIDYGLKMSYQLSEVSRSQEFTEEPHRDRTFFISWLSISFGASYYY